MGSYFADRLVLAHSDEVALVSIRLDLRTDPVHGDLLDNRFDAFIILCNYRF